MVQPSEDPRQQAKIIDTWRAPRDGNRFYALYELGCRFAAIKDPSKAVEFVPARIPASVQQIDVAVNQPTTVTVGADVTGRRTVYPEGVWGETADGLT